jgi:hypothetical protein
VTVAWIVVTLATVAAVGVVAVADLLRAPFVLANSRAVAVPETWLTPLGLVKGAGAVGLLAGLAGARPIGVTAGIGLTSFFVGAVAIHLRAGDHHLTFPLAYLALTATSTTLLLTT